MRRNSRLVSRRPSPYCVSEKLGHLFQLCVARMWLSPYCLPNILISVPLSHLLSDANNRSRPVRYRRTRALLRSFFGAQLFNDLFLPGPGTSLQKRPFLSAIIGGGQAEPPVPLTSSSSGAHPPHTTNPQQLHAFFSSLHTKGLRVGEVPAEGNCLFHTFIQFLQGGVLPPQHCTFDHASLRTTLCNFMLKTYQQSDDFQTQFEDHAKSEYDCTFNDYLS